MQPYPTRVDPSAIRVFVEDHGQDFLRFTLRDQVIEDSNAQGYLWDGKRVVNTNIKPGDTIEFEDGKTLKYRVVTVSFVMLEETDGDDD